MRGDENIGMEIAESEAEETVKEGSVAVEDETSKEDEEETDEEEKEEETDRLSELEILPGKTAYINFYYTIDPEIEGMKDQDIRFSFDWTQENKDGKEEKHNKKEEFCYSVDALNLLTVTTGGEKGWVEVGKEDEMLLEFDLGQMREILDEAVEEELEKHEDDDASASEARRASASEILVGWDEENGSRPLGKKDPAVIKKLKCEVETFGLKLNKFKAAPVTDDDNYGTSLKCDFLVSRNNVPGTYYGQVKASYEINNRTYHTTQAFKVVVKQETGEIELTGKIGDGEIIMSGPASSFPPGDDLSLKVSEITPEQQEKVDEALRKKAEEEGTEITQYKALDIKLVVDGEETEPLDNVQVRFKNVELEKVGEKKEEQEKTEEKSIVKRMMRRVMAVFSDEEETKESEENNTEINAIADIDSDKRINNEAEVAKNDINEKEDAENKPVESNDTIKVLHLDEDTIGVNEIPSEVKENGDIVMGTDHFSIYIIVNLPDNVKYVKVKIKHWAEMDQWQLCMIDGNRISADETYKTQKYIPSWGTTVNRIVPGARQDGTFEQKKVEIYSEDEFNVPNGAGTGIEYAVLVDKFSKVSAGGNYEVKKINVNGTLYEKEGNTVKITEGGQETQTSEDVNIPLKAGENIIDIEYSLTKGTMIDDVGFHDYNAMYVTDKDSVEKKQRGINHPKLENGVIQEINTKTDRIVVGNEYLGFIGYDGIGINHTGDKITKGIVKSKLDDTVSNTLQFNVADPGLFVPHDILINEVGHPKYAKKYLTDYQLDFERNGDTYTLRSVLDKDGKEIEGGKDLNILGESYTSTSKQLYSNLFWPLDGVSYTNSDGDPQIGGNFGFATNDENSIKSGVKHNWFFGMRYDFNFTLGDYIGPMNYYFRGDDDFWLYIDGELVVDIGGIHSAIGQYIDLRKEWVDKKISEIEEESQKANKSEEEIKSEVKKFKEKPHRMTVYYMERGGFGSCCYMTFTLPGAQPVAVPGAETVSRTVEKNWNDKNNVDGVRPKEVQIQLYQDNEPFGNAVSLKEENGWKYTWTPLPKYKNSTTNELHDYWIKEVTVHPGYQASIDLDTAQTADKDLVNPTITMSGNIKVNTAWEETNKAKPDKIWIELYQKKGTNPAQKIGDAIELSESNGWCYQWKNQPFYDNSSKTRITYEVRESKVPEEIKKETSAFSLTMIQTGNIYVKKEWSGNSSKPFRILLRLYKTEGNENEKEDELIILSEENGWEYHAENVTFYDFSAKKDISYRLEERIEKVDGNGSLFFKVTNTYCKMDIKVIKEWKDDSDVYRLRPASISVELQVNTSPDENGEYSEEDYKTVGTVELNQSNEWSYIWKDLWRYTVVDAQGNTLTRPIKNKYRIRESTDFSNSEYYEKPDWVEVEQSEGKETIVKLTNTLKMARLRVTKHISTEALITEPVILENGEVLAEPIAKPYKFMIAIQNVDDPNERYEVSLSHDETSGYIWIPMGDVAPTEDPLRKSKTFIISETEPMEYTMISMELIGEGDVEDNKLYSTKVDEDGTTTKELLAEFIQTGKTGTITLYPDADAHVQVNNLPEHADYFHHTYSVTNKNQMNSSAEGNGFNKKDGYYDERDQHATNETVPKKQASVTTEYDYAIAYMGEAVNGKEKKMDWGDDLNAWT